MRPIRLVRQAALLSALSILAIAATPASFSDPVGIYALIDKVVMTPPPQETIQIWGTFALSTGSPGDNYKPAQRGYLYYGPATDARVSRAEWNDLQSVAGSGQVVGFGRRYVATGRVRSSSEVPTAPDTYPLGIGVLRSTNNPYFGSIGRDLASIPVLVSAIDGSTVKAGQVRLAVRSVKDTSVRYIFAIDGAGQHEVSEPLPGGKTETSWTPKLMVRAGEDYLWRVHVTAGNWSGQPVASSIRVAK